MGESVLLCDLSFINNKVIVARSFIALFILKQIIFLLISLGFVFMISFFIPGVSLISAHASNVVSMKTNDSEPVKFANLKPGDLLFQDLDGGPLSEAITEATIGIDNDRISHVAIVISTEGPEPVIIEAYADGVKAESLSTLLARSSDEQGSPRVIVGRLKPEYQALIPKAIAAAQSQLGQPYNKEFLLSSEGFYCSQLIAYIFKQANTNVDFFVQQPMNFKNLITHRYPTAWKDYFEKIGKPIPQSELGTNPAEFSRDPRIDIVYRFGKLRVNEQLAA